MKIQNPRIEFDSDTSVAALFEYDGARYHIWLDAATGKPLDGSPLYKNPARRPDGTFLNPLDDGYFDTRRLNPTAKANLPLMAELFAAMDFEKSRAEYIAECRRKREELRRQRLEVEHVRRLQALFTFSEEELRQAVLNAAVDYATCKHRAESESVKRYADMLAAIFAYRFPDSTI